MNKKLIIFAVSYWLVVSAIAIFVYPVLMSDTMNRYAPMADAFAAGDWFHAFHPRFGVLYSVLTGLFATLGFRGDHACQIVSIGFLAFSAIPAWYVMRRIFDEKVACITAALILLMPEYFVFAIDGLRDTARILAVLLIAYTFITDKRPWVLAAGVFIMATLRTDMQLLAIIVVGAWAMISIRQKNYRAILLPLGSLLLGLVLCSIMVYAFTGVFLPNAHAAIYMGGVR